MRNLTRMTEKICEGDAIDCIFNACRANTDRQDKNGVSFTQLINGNEYQAVLRDATGIVIAIAIVDEFDC